MSIVEITIAELKEGMFVCGLDLPWMQNPFFRSKFAIKTQNEIAQLKAAGCKSLKIDTSKGLGLDSNALPSAPGTTEPVEKLKEIACENESRPSEVSLQAPSFPATPSKHPLQEKPRNMEALKERHKAAFDLRNKTLAAIQDVNQSLAKGHALSQGQILPILDDLAGQLQENEQAILATLTLKPDQSHLNTHLYNTLALALSLGNALKLDQESLMHLGQAALFHDVGWMKLPSFLVNKGRPLTPQESELAKQHVALGVAQLSKSKGFPQAVMNMVSSHHQPFSTLAQNINELSPDEISRCVLRTVDTYDEITHGLFGNLGAIPGRAMKQLFGKVASGQFHKAVLSLFIHHMGVYPVGSAVQLSDQSKGIVVHQTPDAPLKPQIMLCYDSGGIPLKVQTLLDIHTQESLEVERFLDPLNKQDDPAGLLAITEV